MRLFQTGLYCAFVVVPSSAFAQTPPPLPPPEPPTAQPAPLAPSAPPSAAPSSSPNQPLNSQPQYQPSPAYPPPPPPPPPPYQPPPSRAGTRLYAPADGEVGMTRAPKFSLWAGARLSYIGFGGSFYDNSLGKAETTGNFVGTGIAPEIDIGARISYRYIPFAFWEHGFLAAGHRFDGDNASASTDYYGVGFRFLSGDVNSVAFLSEIAIGERVISVTSNGSTFRMRGIEFFKLGFGAEIRIHSLFTIEPVLSISTGVLNDTSGTVRFSTAGSRDGITQPDFRNGDTISDNRAYFMMSLGVGAHFDIFGM